MTEFGDPAFFDRYAHEYDARHQLDPGAAVDFLAARVPEGARVLELAIGTGRVALPLAARGVAVAGIEGSPAMVERLRAKPGGAAIPTVVGDMAEVAVDGPYGMAYLVFNTLFNLTSQERQVAMEYQRHDPVAQTVTYQRVTIGPDGTTLRPLRLRYAWPSELDLMARLAGMRLAERYADWDGSPFTAASTRHVSVYERLPLT